MNGTRQVKADKTTRKGELSLNKTDMPKENDVDGWVDRVCTSKHLYFNIREHTIHHLWYFYNFYIFYLSFT